MRRFATAKYCCAMLSSGTAMLSVDYHSDGIASLGMVLHRLALISSDLQ